MYFIGSKLITEPSPLDLNKPFLSLKETKAFTFLVENARASPSPEISFSLKSAVSELKSSYLNLIRFASNSAFSNSKTQLPDNPSGSTMVLPCILDFISYMAIGLSITLCVI